MEHLVERAVFILLIAVCAAVVVWAERYERRRVARLTERKRNEDGLDMHTW